MFCPQCGKAIKEGAKFCGECGWAVPAAPVSVAPVVPAPVPQQELPAPAADVSTASKSNASWFAAVAIIGIIFEICAISGIFFKFDLGFIWGLSGIIMLICGMTTGFLIIREGKEKISIWYKAFLIAGLLSLLNFGFIYNEPTSSAVVIYSFYILLLLWIAIAIILFIKERKNV
jgi:hypothetical protein